jgi:glutathione S-transferase
MKFTLVGSGKTRAFRVLWMLEELGIAYDYMPVFPQGSEITAVNPSGKVPALIADDTVIVDSVAINTFLADFHGRFTFPAGTLDRAQQDSFVALINDEMDAVIWTAAKNTFVHPEDKRVPEIKPTLRWEFARSLGILETRMGDGPYLMGAEFTAADILLTHVMNWAAVAKFEVPVDGPLADYLTRVRSRPAYERAMKIREDVS